MHKKKVGEVPRDTCNNMYSWVQQHVCRDLSALCLCCAFHGLGALTFSWQMFGFLRFKWKIYHDIIREELGKKTQVLVEIQPVKKKNKKTKTALQESMRTTCTKKKEERGLPTSDQSRASHSGGQLWLLQGSVRGGRRGVQAESSRTFSSVAEILLLHNTSRVRRPPLQLRLQSDHSPVHQLEAEKSVFNARNHGQRSFCNKIRQHWHWQLCSTYAGLHMKST